MPSRDEPESVMIKPPLRDASANGETSSAMQGAPGRRRVAPDAPGPKTRSSVMVTLDDIEGAGRVLAGHVVPTPMLPAPPLSALTGAEVFVKYENLQVTNSFKERGACVKLAALSPAERRRGVIAMSAGNHAQAVAYHARRLQIPATIVMPVTTPFVKVQATEAHGADIILSGETLAEAQARAEAIAAERNL